ncbi:mersacidin/lichenicidin family type 2 lantibiotic [Alteromonas flava]|uniref:mersacidin/lichenicidin family type 2 lantibiotic n=1 Tax=Alteromonas flava TaxID=2048003 RepID=UPI000C28BAB4|nr:mersacidin/lichenicidin family type 2 lantibiotic [Alteromonas flava]
MIKSDKNLNKEAFTGNDAAKSVQNEIQHPAGAIEISDDELRAVQGGFGGTTVPENAGISFTDCCHAL